MPRESVSILWGWGGGVLREGFSLAKSPGMKLRRNPLSIACALADLQTCRLPNFPAKKAWLRRFVSETLCRLCPIHALCLTTPGY